MRTPAITPAQLVAAVGSLLGVLVAFGVLDDVRSQAILTAASTVVPVALVVADLFLRRARIDALASGLAVARGGRLLDVSTALALDERAARLRDVDDERADSSGAVLDVEGPQLGLATTAQLHEELQARAEVGGYAGYTTAGRIGREDYAAADLRDRGPLPRRTTTR